MGKHKGIYDLLGLMSGAISITCLYNVIKYCDLYRDFVVDIDHIPSFLFDQKLNTTTLMMSDFLNISMTSFVILSVITVSITGYFLIKDLQLNW